MCRFHARTVRGTYRPPICDRERASGGTSDGRHRAVSIPNNVPVPGASPDGCTGTNRTIMTGAAGWLAGRRSLWTSDAGSMPFGNNHASRCRGRASGAALNAAAGRVMRAASKGRSQRGNVVGSRTRLPLIAHPPHCAELSSAYRVAGVRVRCQPRDFHAAIRRITLVRPSSHGSGSAKPYQKAASAGSGPRPARRQTSNGSTRATRPRPRPASRSGILSGVGGTCPPRRAPPSPATKQAAPAVWTSWPRSRPLRFASSVPSVCR